MRQYIKMLRWVFDTGVRKHNRTGVDTVSVFGYQFRHDLERGFPLLTTKKLHWKSIVHELLWMISGDTNIKYLNDHGVRIWDEWADSRGDLGPVYGEQWRAWDHYNGSKADQLSNVIDRIKQHPDCRRLIVNSWNVTALPEMRLPPCHVMYQFNVTNGRLNCHMYQRSADIFLGVPFNIASYALLTMLVAQCCDLDPGELIISFGDLHLYVNHAEQAVKQMDREIRSLPTVTLNENIKCIDDFRYFDITLQDYNPHSGLKAKVAV